MSARPLTIPTIYSIIDKVTKPMSTMSSAVVRFGEKAEASLSRLDRKMRPLKKSAAVTGAAIAAPFVFAANEASKYQDAVASFHTIVSDKNGEAFDKYERSIKQVGDETNATYNDVAVSYEKIAGLNNKFADTAESISAVTKATITLSRASRDDLGTSAENLVGIMNQYDLAADQANRTINVLAAGQAVGAASISQVSEAMKNFGSTAHSSNITLEQSVGLIETLGKFSIFGAEAGTKLRGAISKLQEAGYGYKSGQFEVNDALEEARKKYDKLRSAKKKDAFITKKFGLENKAAGIILLNNIPLLKEMTAGVTGTSEAQKAAAYNANTFSARLAATKANIQNLAVTVGENLLPPLADLVEKIIPVIKSISEWVKKNPAAAKSITKVALSVAALSFAVSATAHIIGVATKIMAGWNALMAIGTKIQKSYAIAVSFAGKQSAILNAIMSVNPVFALIAGFTAIALAIWAYNKATTKLSASERVANQVQERAIENSVELRTEVTTLFAALRKCQVGTEQYEAVLAKIEAIQPGITKQYNLQAGAIDDITRAEKSLTESIMQRAMVEARAEILKEKAKKYQEMLSSGPSTWDFIKGSMAGGRFAGAAVQENWLKSLADLDNEIKVLTNAVANDEAGKSPKSLYMMAKGLEPGWSTLENQKTETHITLDLNDPFGVIKPNSGKSDSPFVVVHTTPSKVVP